MAVRSSSIIMFIRDSRATRFAKSEMSQQTLNDDHCDVLGTAITRREVKKAIFDMSSEKSPGPDGYTAGFYKDFWDVVGADVTDAIISFFEEHKLPHFVNSISLALIPKRTSDTDAKDYRLISCCNVIYKAISKVLANRLRYVLPDLINAAQYAFIQGRLIGDNILLAHELLRTYSRPNVTPRCAIKVDLMKAFDSIEW
ncbi:Transposon TX1 uncharacterized 149 kDa protein, partial [Linum grandiflorum]